MHISLSIGTIARHGLAGAVSGGVPHLATQGNRPVPRRRQAYYFEALIVEAGDQGKVCIGFSDKAFKMGKQPG